jgi:hypothetical protein
MDHKLVASVDIEHLNQGQAAYQFHAAQILLEEEHKRHAARVQELESFIRDVRPRVHPGDLQPMAAANIRALLRGEVPANMRPDDAAKNPAPAAPASSAS